MKLPVPVDARRLRARLAVEERELLERLAALEARVRRFADVERPAYESWRRLEFGPLLATLQEVSDELRLRSVLADRLQVLVEREGLDPREALHRAQHPAARATRGGFDPDEVEARRRAKLERKRAQRRDAKRDQRAAGRKAESGAPAAGASARPARVVDLYRALARRIHPDSPSALRGIASERLGALWADVQDAYESASLERLLAISAWVESLGEADGNAPPLHGSSGASARSPLLSLSERHERLRALRRSCRALERDLDALRSDPAWEFAEQQRHGRSRLARRTRDAIEQEIDRVRRALAEVEELFAAIGSPRPPRPRRRR